MYMNCVLWQEVLNSVEVYDPLVGSWSPASPLLTRRSGVSAAVLGDKIYVLGGFDGSNRYPRPWLSYHKGIVSQN